MNRQIDTGGKADSRSWNVCWIVSYEGTQFRNGFLGELKDYGGGFSVCYKEDSNAISAPLILFMERARGMAWVIRLAVVDGPRTYNSIHLTQLQRVRKMLQSVSILFPRACIRQVGDFKSLLLPVAQSDRIKMLSLCGEDKHWFHRDSLFIPRKFDSHLRRIGW